MGEYEETDLIHFVVALQAEARPLIRHFGLKAVHGSESFPRYEEEEMRLVISGVGKSASAAATAFLHGVTGEERNVVWINVGVGGHRDLDIGEGVLAHKVTDKARGESWYPPQLFDASFTTGPVLTVDEAEVDYDGPWVYEMEASGFYSTACRFSVAELVQCLKIVSDNLESPLDQVSIEKVDELIGSRLPLVEQIVRSTAELEGELEAIEADPAELTDFLDRWRFTVSEQHQLKRLLRRLQTLSLRTNILNKNMQSLEKGKAVLARLEEQLDHLVMEGI